jgi:hypothetical protein
MVMPDKFDLIDSMKRNPTLDHYTRLLKYCNIMYSISRYLSYFDYIRKTEYKIKRWKGIIITCLNGLRLCLPMAGTHSR